MSRTFRHSRICSFHVFLAALALGTLNCDDDDEFTQTCRSLCRSLACTDGVDSDACTDELVARRDDAAMLGEDCEVHYHGMIVCAEAIVGCSETENWKDLRGSDLDYPCRGETEKFLASCPDLWFPDKTMN